jgi:hypothetical protein
MTLSCRKIVDSGVFQPGRYFQPRVLTDFSKMAQISEYRTDATNAPKFGSIQNRCRRLASLLCTCEALTVRLGAGMATRWEARGSLFVRDIRLAVHAHKYASAQAAAAKSNDWLRQEPEGF